MMEKKSKLSNFDRRTDDIFPTKSCSTVIGQVRTQTGSGREGGGGKAKTTFNNIFSYILR